MEEENSYIHCDPECIFLISEKGRCKKFNVKLDYYDYFFKIAECYEEENEN